MTADRAIFANLLPIYNVSITTSNGKKVQAEGMGDVQVGLNDLVSIEYTTFPASEKG